MVADLLLGDRFENMTASSQETNLPKRVPENSVPVPLSRPNARIVLVTPVCDEAGFIGDMIESISRQEVRPARWVIVDDGSTDSTPKILRDRASRLEFIDVVTLPVRRERRPGGEGAIAAALRRVDLAQVDYLARFDGDLLFQPDYFARVIDEFEREPKLGIAGGGLYVVRDGVEKLEKCPLHHVRGALKMYRRECFEQLGGLSSQIGWDTIDEVYAWTRGWRTRSFPEIRVIHRRPTGEGISASRVYFQRGKAEYLTWSHPLFVAGKVAKLFMSSPATAVPFAAGFLAAYRNRLARLQDPRFVEARRKQQLARMRGAPSPWV